MRKGTLEEARELLLDIRFGYKPRKVSGPWDWGDNATVLLHVKRMNKDFYHLDLEKDFGRYLGNNIVGIKDHNGVITSCEIFDSESEMKQEWMLD
jgi:hypothetical protein